MQQNKLELFALFSTSHYYIFDVQGLFVPFARVGSGDPVKVLRLLHNKYTGYK